MSSIVETFKRLAEQNDKICIFYFYEYHSKPRTVLCICTVSLAYVYIQYFFCKYFL